MRMHRCTAALLAAVCFANGLRGRPAAAAPVVLVVVGAGGSEEYEELFAKWADSWQAAAAAADAEFRRVGPGDESTDGQTDLQQLASELESLAGESNEPAWIVLLGHGTYDGAEAKFNLAGPDVTAAAMAERLEGLARPTAIVNCASSSAPFLNALSGDGRVVVTATRSGHESNFARFGGFLASAIADPASDVDKDDQVSLLEAFLVASRRTSEFYREEARLATEHALLDDNGDALGTPADWFRGVRAIRRAAEDAERDGVRAHQFHLVRSPREQLLTPEQRTRRDALEAELESLREQKSGMDEAAYYGALEPIAVELAQLYEATDPDEETADPAEAPAADEPDDGAADEAPAD